MDDVIEIAVFSVNNSSGRIPAGAKMGPEGRGKTGMYNITLGELKRASPDTKMAL